MPDQILQPTPDMIHSFACTYIDRVLYLIWQLFLHGQPVYMLRMRLNFDVEDCFALNCTLRSLYDFPK